MTKIEPESVSRFREYLKIKAVHPNVDYEETKVFLVNQAKEIGLECKVVECVPGKPIVIMKLPGANPELKSILLSSHTDVVPVFEEFWSYPPFAAERVPTDDGDFKIYARGSQDMKVTTCMHLEALRNIISSGSKPLRNIYVVLAPDEEIGGEDGVKKFVETQDFADLNIGFDFDEGPLTPDDNYAIYYSERTISQVTFTAHGNTGHGSQFIEGTAIEKLLPIINALMARREEERLKLDKLNNGGSGGKSSANMRAGEVTTINLTELSGGKQANVVPATYSVTFDIRVTPKIDLDEFRAWVDSLAKKHGVKYEYVLKNQQRSITPLDRNNPLIDAFFKGMEAKNLPLTPIISIGATDARHVRTKGVPAFGFSAINNSQRLAHAHDEFVHESKYLKGIEIFTHMISTVANVPAE